MEPTSTGDLVTVATRGPQLDGIVFDVPSSSKLVVAVMDPTRGPVLRSVDRSAATERTEAGPDDPQLQLLIRRTPPVNRGAAHAVRGAGAGRAGHKRAAMHRTTGK
jgi:hypothetical protein